MDIFVINISNTKNIKTELLEQFEYKNYSNQKKMLTHRLTYLMLNRILDEVYKIQNCEIEFINNKPYLKTKEKYFSISHSGKYIVIAFSDSECGVDIEKIKNRDYISIAKRMNFSCDSLEDFYKAWTKYEAEYKLRQKSESIYQTILENYTVSAVSNNIQEKFNLYIQTFDNFSNL